MTCQINSVPSEDSCPSWFRQHSVLLLFAILLLAAVLRLICLEKSPPGLNQDEAISAWPAYCLLKTGKDNVGQSWPIYYMRGLGGNNPTLFTYLTIPFQAIGGLNIYTTRLPAAFAGIFAVWLIYYTAKKLFDTETALAAALLLALNPWHLQQSRWGHEASIAPLLGLIPLAIMLWANLPLTDNKNASPRPLIAGIGGVLAGVGCFGYHAVRLFVPVFIFACFLFNLPAWWRTVKTRKGVLAAALFIIGFTAIFGQLAYQHIVHPEGIGRHGIYQSHWVGNVSPADFLKNSSLRYIRHFAPDFLFVRGDEDFVQGPVVGGQFHWYAMPLMFFGAILVLKKFITSVSLRTTSAFVLTYPIGDCFVWNSVNLHALRSAPGLCALVLLSAVGLIAFLKWIRRFNLLYAKIAVIVFAIFVIGFNARFLYHFFGEFNRRSDVYHMFHTDLVETCEWLKPRFDDFDAIYFTTDSFNMPYVITTVILNYDPKKWFNEPIEFNTPKEWDFYTRYGKMHFIYDLSDFSLSDLQKQYPGRLLVILRPAQFILHMTVEKLNNPENPPDESASAALIQNLKNIDNPSTIVPEGLSEHIVHKIYDPNGDETLWLCKF